MNQSHSRSSIKCKERPGVDDAEGSAQLQRISKQLEDFSRLSEIQEVLSPYWAARSEIASHTGSY